MTTRTENDVTTYSSSIQYTYSSIQYTYKLFSYMKIIATKKRFFSVYGEGLTPISRLVMFCGKLRLNLGLNPETSSIHCLLYIDPRLNKLYIA